MTWIVLPTDCVMGILILGLMLYALWVRRDARRRTQWARVFSRPTVAAAGSVLLFLTGIAAVDSVHFRTLLSTDPNDEPIYSTVTRSALEYLITEKLDAAHPERSYSTPFALREFDKSTALINGERVRDFQPLKAPIAHPASTEQLAQRAALAALCGAIVGALLGAAPLLSRILTRALAGRLRAQGRDASRASDALDAASSPNAPQATRAACYEEGVSPALLAATITLALLFALAFALLCVWPSRHPFGTDAVGSDVLLSALQSIRTALVIGTLATLSTLPFAITLGIAAGYFRGWIDDVIQYLYTTLSSIPGVLLIAASVLMLQGFMDAHPDLWATGLERADVRLFSLALIIGLTGWASLARLLRAESMKLSALDYVRAAKALGVSNTLIMWRHILPNVFHMVLIVAVLDFSGIVLYEAVLSYVGVGVDPSMNSFGTMINAARSEMSRTPMVWWNLAAAFLFMLALVLCANVLAAAVRDAFDPRARVQRPVRRPREQSVTTECASAAAAQRKAPLEGAHHD